MTDHHQCEQCKRPAPTTTICTTCQDHLYQNLDQLPNHITELLTQLSRQARGPRGEGGKNAETPLPFDLRASETLDLLRSLLTGWTRDLPNAPKTRQEAPTSHGTPKQAPEHQPPTLRGMTAVLRHYGDWPTHPDVAQFADELAYVTHEIRTCIDTGPGRRYLGPCATTTDNGPCQGDVYQVGNHQPTCRTCHTTHTTDERLQWIAELAQDQLVTATTAAGCLNAWGTHITPELIRTWAQRGRITPKAHDQNGRPLYAFADCRTLALNTLKRRTTHQQRTGT